MKENELFEAIEAAYSGAVHVEELAAGLAPETRNSSDVIREGLETIYWTIGEVETILSYLLAIHKDEAKTAERLEQIEEAARRIAIIERPELAEEDGTRREAHPVSFVRMTEGIKEEMPFN